jgi:diguanylate cyclase (GGDEF)-like protein
VAGRGETSALWPRTWPGQPGLGAPIRGQVYFTYLVALCVLFAGTWLVSAIHIRAVLAAVPASFWVLATLAVVVETPLFAVPRGGRAMVSASVSFTFAMSFTWANGTGRAAQAVAILVGGLLSRRATWTVIFDLGRYGLALTAVGTVGALAGGYPVPPDASHLAYVLSAAVLWYVVFRLLTATEAWLRVGGSWPRAVVTEWRPEALSAAALLLLAPMFIAIIQVNAWLLPLVLVPLYAVGAMSRVWYEQAQGYLVDRLTGLANRTAMARVVRREIARVAAAPPEGRDGQADGVVGLLVVDLHEFQLINEALGYEVADRLLVAVGQRLVRRANPNTVVCRLKGDEFGMLVSRLSHEDDVRALADSVHAQFAEPLTVDGQQLTVDACIGIAVYPQHGANFEALAQHADTALRDAKELPNGVAMFQPGTESLGPQRWSLLGDLRRVLDQAGNTEIVPHYQPEMDLASGHIVGVEALLRWRHPSRGMLSPEEVVTAAEHSPLMQKLTRRMVEQVLEQLSRWHSHGFTIRASVNVSAHDLYTGDFVAWLQQQLSRYGVAPTNLQLEITESALMTQPMHVLASLRSLRQLGVGAALDDFGTGFSSLEHLRRLPLTEVKIDRSFTQSIVDDEDANAIVRAIIDLGASLGLRVVAEGVENEATRLRLLDDGCRVGQGWYYAQAMSGDDFDHWLTVHLATGHPQHAGSS